MKVEQRTYEVIDRADVEKARRRFANAVIASTLVIAMAGLGCAIAGLKIPAIILFFGGIGLTLIARRLVRLADVL